MTMAGDRDAARPTPSLLIVDDNPVNLLVLRLMLARAGYAPLEASDGLEAVTMASAEKPDLILMDIMMPRMDGIAAAGRILDQASGTPPKIVAVTGNTEERLREECLAAGFCTVLHKPVDARELLATINRLTTRSAKIGGRLSGVDAA